MSQEAIAALDKAEKELLEKLAKIRAAKAALQEDQPRKRTRKHARKECDLPGCTNVFNPKRTNSLYCSEECTRESYERRTQRNPSYKPGGKLYNARWSKTRQTPDPTDPPPKPVQTLLKGDPLKAGH